MRDTSQLHPKLQLKLLQLIMLCNEKGLKIQITECLRTKEEQDALFAQGRTKPGNVVTNAPGSSYSSCHQWGIAADYCRADGRAAFDNSDGFFDKVGKIGMQIGLEWGGSWTSPVDKPHFQLPDWGSTPNRLRQLYGTPENFFKTWAPLEKTMQVSHESYLRSSPSVDHNRVPYSSLSNKVKAKCKDKDGYAIIKKGKTFTKTGEEKENGNTWAHMKSGYWFPEVYKGKIRSVPS